MLIAGGVIVVAVLLYLALRPPAVAVSLARVDRGPLQSIVQDQGKTRVRQDYVVSAPVSGRLSRVNFVEGDVVTKGMLIAQFDAVPFSSAISADEARLAEIAAQSSGVASQVPKPEAISQARDRLTAAVQQAQAQQASAAQARARLAQAVRDRDRARSLYAGGAIARADLEASELSATSAAAQLTVAERTSAAADAQASEAKNALGQVLAQRTDPDYLYTVYGAQAVAVQADLRRLEDDLAHARVYSPVSGRVLRVYQKSEDYVAAGKPIVDVGDSGNLEMVVDLLSTSAIAVRPGAPMIVDDGSDTWRYRGRVRYVEPSGFTKISALGVEEQRVNVIGDFIGTHAGFGDAYRVEARIITWEGREALRVPIAALFRCGTDWCAFADEGGRAREKHVTVGHMGETSAEVLSGLAEGSSVIVYPSEQLADGARVQVVQ